MVNNFSLLLDKRYFIISLFANNIILNRMKSIYFNKIAIRFKDKFDNSFARTVNIELKDNEDVNKVVETLRNKGFNNDIYLYGNDIENMYVNFCRKHTYIEAAGGIVINQKSQYLLIKRFGIWDLPKGKIESGETKSIAAIREVCEETGLSKVEIIKTLPDTFHIYIQKNMWFIKRTYWFLMQTKEYNLIPQIEEDITDAIWMDKNNACTAIGKSYRSLSDTLGFVFS